LAYGISHKHPTYDGAVNTTHHEIVHSTMGHATFDILWCLFR